jgi:RNA polymerase sigma-70 factor (ECF subfamily)
MFSTDRELIHAVIDGDPGAGDAFVTRFTRFVRSILLHEFRLGAEEADDLFQTVFERLWEEGYRRLRLWHGDGDFAPYLGPIVRNTALDHFRRAGRDPLRDCINEDTFELLVGSEPSPEEQAGVEERRRMVERALETLGSRDRELYRLRYVEELKYREIGEILGMNTNSVSQALWRLEQRLERLVDDRLRGRRPSRRGAEDQGVRSPEPGASPE